MASFQLPGFQPAGFTMTMLPGTQMMVPAMLFSAQPEEPAPTNTRIARARSQSRPSKASDARAPAGPCCGKAASAGIDQHACDLGMTLADFDGELPSVGSEGHFDGSCKRCAFFPKGRCTNGKDCTHCHFAHEPRSRLRKRNSMKGQKSASQDEIATAEDTCHTDALMETRPHLSEPATESSACSPRVSAPANGDVHLEVTNTKTRQGDDIMMMFNSALEDLAEAYMTDSDANAKGAAQQDSPTTSALSDREDMSTMSCTDSEELTVSVSNISMHRALSETSESETASMQAGLSQLDQEELSSPPSASTPTSWLSMQRSRKTGKNAKVDIGRMTRALLNKLTEQRFDSLCGQILSLPISTPEELAVVVAEIFQKATTQDGFRNLYTELCMRLDAHFGPTDTAIGGKTFRNALVNECQATFERNLQPADAALFSGLNTEESFEVEMMLKTRRLGNMRFIGDLLVRRLLSAKLLLPIVQQLLNSNEAALESLIALLNVVGPEFEMKQSLYQAALRDAFAVLRAKMSDKAVCARVGCQINDLLDAKARGWALRSTSC